MENQFEKIANINFTISENCPDEKKKIIQLYWEFINNKFLNLPKLLKKRFAISQSELNKLNSTYADISLHIFCKKCISYEKHYASSQSNFKRMLSQENRYSSFTCNHCQEEARKQRYSKELKKQKELVEKKNKAIENKNWEKLSYFEIDVLKNSLEMRFREIKSYYGSKLGYSNFIQLIRALENIESLHLITLQRQYGNNYILNYNHHPRLSEYKKKIIITAIEKKQSKKVTTVNEENNVLKLKLTINEFQNHPDSPKYAGSIIFKEKIVIEPGIEYIFGQWQRANNNMYLTLTPIEDIDKLPIQKRISNHPISLQEGITDLLNNLGKDIDF